MTDRTLSPLDTYTFNKSNTYSLRKSDLARSAQGLSYVTGERALVQENAILSKSLTGLKGDQLHVEVDKFDLNSDEYKEVCHYDSSMSEKQQGVKINTDTMYAIQSAIETFAKGNQELTAGDYKNMNTNLGRHEFAQIANIVDETNTTRNAKTTENIDSLSKEEIDAKKTDLKKTLDIKTKAYNDANETYRKSLADENAKLEHMKKKESEVQGKKDSITSRELTLTHNRDILTGTDIQNKWENLKNAALESVNTVIEEAAEAANEKLAKDEELRTAEAQVGWFRTPAALEEARQAAAEAAEKAEKAEKEKTTLEEIIQVSEEAEQAIKENKIQVLLTAIHKLSELSQPNTLLKPIMQEVLVDMSLINSYVATENLLPDEKNQLTTLEEEAKKAKEEYESSKTNCQSLKDDKESKAAEMDKAQERLEELKFGGRSKDIKIISLGEQNSFFNKGIAKKINDLLETRYGAEVANKVVDHNTINWDEIDNVLADKSKNEAYQNETKQKIKDACIEQLKEFERQIKSSTKLIHSRIETIQNKRSALVQIAKSDIRERIKENKATLVYLDKMRTNDLFERDQKLSHFLTDLDRLQQLWASSYR